MTLVVGSTGGSNGGNATAISIPIPSAAGSLTNESGGTATPAAGQLVDVVVTTLGTGAAPTVPSTSPSGATITTVGSWLSTNVRQTRFWFICASGDLTGTATLALTASVSTTVAYEITFLNAAAPETVATPASGSGSTAGTGGIGSGTAATFPYQAAPAVTGDTAIYALSARAAAGTTPSATWTSSSPSLLPSAGRSQASASGTNPNALMSIADLGLTTSAQAGPTGVTLAATSVFVGSVVAYKPSTTPTVTATAGSALAGTTKGTVTGSATAVTAPTAGHTVTWTTTISATTLSPSTSGTGPNYAATITSGNNTSAPVVTLPDFAGSATLSYVSTDTTTGAVSSTVTQAISWTAQAPTISAPSTATAYVGVAPSALSVTATDPQGQLHSLATPTISGSSGSTVSAAFASGDTGTPPGPSAAVYSVTLTAPTTAGSYTINYSSTNFDGLTGTATTALTVVNPPVAAATVTTSPVDVSTASGTVTLNGSTGSTGTSLTYAWAKTSGRGTLTNAGSNNATLTLSQGAGGTTTGTLTVTDSYGGTSTATWTVQALVYTSRVRIGGAWVVKQLKVSKSGSFS